MMSEVLPPKPDDRVVELNLRHAVLSILAIAGVCLVVGSTLILTRDYAKFRRQKAAADMFAQLIQTVSKEVQWSGEKMDTSSRTKK